MQGEYILDGGRHALRQAGIPVQGPEPGMRLDVCHTPTQIAKSFAQICLHVHQFDVSCTRTALSLVDASEQLECIT